MNVQFAGNKARRICIPIVHDRAHSLQELNEIRKAMHTRIDSILDSSQEFYNREKEKKKEEKVTIKVFNCFGDKPEMIEIEI